jgi:hypothetical protein
MSFRTFLASSCEHHAALGVHCDDVHQVNSLAS